MGNLAPMAFHLTVAGSLEPLADALATVLAEPLDDPFTPELVAVPGGGTRAWLVARLAGRLGATTPVPAVPGTDPVPRSDGDGVPDGIVAKHYEGVDPKVNAPEVLAELEKRKAAATPKPAQ